MILWWLKAWQWHSESCKSLQALTRESQRRTAGCSTATALCICASTETLRKREHRWNSLAEHRTKLGSGGKIIEKLQDSMQEHRNDRKIVSKILCGHNSSQEIRKTQIRFKDETIVHVNFTPTPRIWRPRIGKIIQNLKVWQSGLIHSSCILSLLWEHLWRVWRAALRKSNFWLLNKNILYRHIDTDRLVSMSRFSPASSLLIIDLSLASLSRSLSWHSDWWYAMYMQSSHYLDCIAQKHVLWLDSMLHCKMQWLDALIQYFTATASHVNCLGGIQPLLQRSHAELHLDGEKICHEKFDVLQSSTCWQTPSLQAVPEQFLPKVRNS